MTEVAKYKVDPPPPDPFRDIPPEIRALARERKIIRKVCEQTGYSQAYVSDTFNGRTVKPNTRIVAELIRALKDLTGYVVTQEEAA